MLIVPRELRFRCCSYKATTGIGFGASNARLYLNTLQEIRASLFANATANLLRCSRLSASSIHFPKLNFGQLCGRISMILAA